MLSHAERGPTVTSDRVTLDDLAGYVKQPAWHAAALCRLPEYRGMRWVPGPGEYTPAVTVCADCPARLECLAAAMEGREEGVWGGTTSSQRNTMRKRGLRHVDPQTAPSTRQRGHELRLMAVELKDSNPTLTLAEIAGRVGVDAHTVGAWRAAGIFGDATFPTGFARRSATG